MIKANRVVTPNMQELSTPTYAEERNRVCEDGSEWLKPEMKAFMSGKLYESNQPYGSIRKMKIGFKQCMVKKGIRDTKIYRFYHKIIKGDYAE